MSFQPLIPLAGYAGWRFLSGSLENQVARFAGDPAGTRDVAYFREKIGQVTDAAGLVSDFRLLRVALGAFGLQDDLPNRAFIQKVLSDPVTADTALVNRLADKRYRAFAEAFGFGGPLPPRNRLPGFADNILARSTRQDFERAVGSQSPDMRLALAAQREVPELAARGLTDTTSWLSVLGNPPLRKVFETAFGLPASIGTLDLDLQLKAFRDGARRLSGSSDFTQFTDPVRVEGLIRSFTLRTEASAGPSPLTPGYSALILLGAIR
ncbi:DUF1217 domain-containing protein [Roseicyclus mahoneyensis]|uniref:Uncharacterized protein DUF1217 n=1 Tax=Roseicyclus mahoneyensis TaxID=164332 RepID=A0A316GIG7_9RHOB|nr:DUF1217 domain-containing protein [Roseicyclus mahoneyensis]PWK59792.1 uncharacterized protein DUF1217 [Roseicyclus mahoneyensis]